MLKVAGFEKESIVDGPGLRYVIFLQGCNHHCEGCHNPQTHDINGGRLVSIDEVYDDIVSTPIITGVTFSGGEPFLQAKNLIPLARKLRGKYHLMCYTGFLYEQLMDNNDVYVQQFLSLLDILVDGPFILKLKSLNCKFRGSTNQRIIDIQQSSAQNVVLANI